MKFSISRLNPVRNRTDIPPHHIPAFMLLNAIPMLNYQILILTGYISWHVLQLPIRFHVKLQSKCTHVINTIVTLTTG